ncbi:MAG: protein TolR [Xanthomonadaceae bacterium]|jgi:biopolymer transport protein TolR|nr:protein TolR [Xanthomonadaceae bacterium]MDE2278492.1 protein TolR [Xanthomonadaceae bacterium]MDE2314804.1 protein TolR [Xanthomonadaceae bacterium]
MRNAKRPKRYKLKSEINVVPYIDVMLVLLIIFMVTTPMLNSNVNVNLPQANAKALQAKKDNLIVQVAKDGSLSLIMGNGKPQPVDEAGLQTKVKAFLDANQQLSVLVAGDTSGNYGGVYKVLADLQQAGVDKVGLMSTPGDGSSQGQGAHGRP